MNYKLLFILTFFVAGFTLNAQNHKKEGEMSVCSNHTSAIRLGEDVVGLALSTGGGVWNEVDPANNTTILHSDVSNIFLAMNRMPGEYHFVFTAKNNPCLADGETALAKVTIIENPLSSSATILLCANDAPELTLSNYLPAGIQGLTVTFYDASGTEVTDGEYEVAASFEGDINFSYEVSGGAMCNTEAKLTLIIEREATITDLPGSKTLEVCKTAIPASVNLNAVLGYNISGEWAVDNSATVGGATGATVSGSMVDLSGLTFTGDAASITYKLTPTTDECYETYTPSVTISIEDDLSGVGAETIEVCKTASPQGYINLMEVLGINVPVNVGQWRLVNDASPVDVQDGIFELADARAGDYVYKYEVSNAADICGLVDAQVTIEVSDISEAYDGEVQVCAGGQGVSVTLDNYILGLPSGAKWYEGLAAEGTELASSTITTSADPGMYAYTYSYDAGPCGNASGHLYVTVTDELTNFKDKVVEFCLTDNGTDAINLDQILGVAGVSGDWEFVSGSSTSGHTANEIAAYMTDNVFNANAAAGAETTDTNTGVTKNTGTYVFKFTAGAGSCIEEDSEATITIKVVESW
ncbi:hypothetical protein [Carboxylicivirga sp. RSCT41]|uniref:hypothetical protein n=1 Tax=Carboxylicivirga agarovorans TaxID=3417570 RepID=UPI003D3328BB